MTNFEKAKACVDQTVHDWGKTKLTDIEKYSIEQYIIWGMVDMALRFLSDNEYQRLKQYIYDEYGYNVGGVVTKAEDTLAIKEWKAKRNPHTSGSQSMHGMMAGTIGR